MGLYYHYKLMIWTENKRVCVKYLDTEQVQVWNNEDAYIYYRYMYMYAHSTYTIV